MDNINIAVELAKKEKELIQNAEKYDCYFVAAKQRLDAFKRQYSRVLEKGAELCDMDYPIKLSWILLGIDRAEALSRHQERYKYVYDQLNAYETEVAKWAPYAKIYLSNRIKRDKEKLKQQLEYKKESERIAWEEARSERLKKIFSKIKVYGGPFLLKNLKIRVDQNICTVSCSQLNMYWPSDGWHYYRKTLINQPINVR